jgi:hypothetical protein
MRKGGPPAPRNRVAAGNFNFGASVAATGWSLTTGMFWAGTGAVISNVANQASAGVQQTGIAEVNDSNALSGQPLIPVPPMPPSTTGPGFPGFPTRGPSGLMNQGDQDAPNENQAVAAGYLWQSLGCHQ